MVDSQQDREALVGAMQQKLLFLSAILKLRLISIWGASSGLFVRKLCLLY